MAAVYEFSQENDWEKYITKAEMPMVMDFFTPWCEPCKELDPVLDAAAKKYTAIRFYKYNLDKFYYRANKYKVEGIPFLILFLPSVTSEGEPAIFEQVAGYLSYDMLEKKLDALMKKWKPE